MSCSGQAEFFRVTVEVLTFFSNRGPRIKKEREERERERRESEREKRMIERRGRGERGLRDKE